MPLFLLGWIGWGFCGALVALCAQVPFTPPQHGGSLTTKTSAFTPKTMLEIPLIGETVANPSGTFAAVFVSRLDLDTDKLRFDVFVPLNADADIPSYELAIASDGNAFWYDDLTLVIAIRNSTSRTTTLYAHYVSPEVSILEPGELIGTLPTDSASNFQFSPAAQALVFSDYVYPDGDLSKTVENERAWMERKDTALMFDGSTFTRIMDKYTSPRRPSLFTMRVTVDWDGRWRLVDEYINLLADTGHHVLVEGTLDGKQAFHVSDYLVVYTTKDPTLPEALHTKADVYVVDIFARAPPRELTSGRHGATSGPVFSPDGRRIAWLEDAVDGRESSENYIVMHDLEKNEKSVLLRNWDRSPNQLSFSSDGAYLYIVAPDMARIKIFVYPLLQLPSDSLVPKPVTHEGVVSRLQSLPGNRLLFKRQTMANPGDLFILEGLLDVKKAHARQLTDLSRDSLRHIEKPERTEFFFKGAAGRRVHGFTVKPAGWTVEASRNRTWPVALIIHGGPEYFEGDMWNTHTHPYTFAHRGYFFIAINPTGSISFGKELTEAINGDWGGDPFKDLRIGFKQALQIHPEIDSERAVAVGGSYGGYAINWIQSNPEFGFNFKALVCLAGIFDLHNFAYTIDLNYFMNYEWTGKPWEKNVLKKFAEQSPSSFVHKWSTPQLIFHGDIDFRVPVTEGIAAFSALQQRGVPSRLIIFKEESHGWRKPHNLLIYYDEMFRWLDFYVNSTSTAF
ncbi:alpha/beta-hydrolase [Vararia minispora EC-137]|uniref:Alpha/beta-hydrolase n=1 Tax=Vararia minispora EC-137 TaxID=1314806 RepID=A0ACB8Q9N8_9AGAM|nr:alpha/beta-hydrolase [Vararia minispora EC-137]